MDEKILIINASENNLDHLTLEIPKEKLVVLAGVSGSGKSTLAFDTLAAESSRQWQATYPMFLRSRLPRYERPAVDRIENLTPCVVVDQKSIGANSRSTVGTAVDVAPLVRLLFSRVGTPSAGGSMAYSFNHPNGMCPACTGLGEQVTLNEEKLFDLDRSINDGAIRFSQFSDGSWQSFYFRHNPLFPADKKLRDFTPEEWHALRIGPDKPLYLDFIRNNTGQVSKLPYEGVVTRFNRLYLHRDTSGLAKAVRNEAMLFVNREPCSTCGGTGLNPKALESRINGYNIANYQEMPVSELLTVLAQIDHPVGKSIAGQISQCLHRMVQVGLGYLSLSRRTDTLSGGEAQRLKLVRHLGSSLSNILYVLDEPTAGLHPADADRIGRLLLELRDQHNTVLVVEHNRRVLELADHIIEMGPSAGTAGGRIIYQGNLEGLRKADTPTAKGLRQTLRPNPRPLPWTESFPLEHVTLHNLKDISVTIPKGVLTVLSGVAGSGKSSLLAAFTSQYPRAIMIDQRPIGTSTRSTPATYTGVMDEIRKVFAKTNGVTLQWFSFNSKGACPVCKGKGEIMPEVVFADPVAILCEECGGRRYNSMALSYTYQGKNIEEVLKLTVEEASTFFAQKKISQPLQLLAEVGLGYMALGQSTASMSGGEIQRLKLAGELQKTGSIYILDEPAAGLHTQDVAKLMELLQNLISKGNTVLVAEHRPEIIAAADWVIDMGPQGGNEGGHVIYQGVPEGLLNCADSRTGACMREMLPVTI